MTTLRQAAEEALEALETLPCGDSYKTHHAAILLIKALAEPECKTHPDAPHGFCRNSSASEDRYVCECEYWEPEPVGQLLEEALGRGQVMWFRKPENEALLYTAPPQREWVGLTDEDLMVCDEDGILLARYWETKLKEKNT